MIKELLKNEILRVEFRKNNGDIRNMICTLHQDVIPKVSGTSVSREGIVTVYDIEADGWRSFKEDSIISYEVITEKSL